MSFDTTDDQSKQNETDQLTFNVGERKYTEEQAITKITASEAHIQTLEAENADYKKQAAQSTSIDDALAALRQPKEEVTPENTPDPQTSGVSAEEIEAIATKGIEKFLADKLIKDNATTAANLSDKTFKETGDALKAIYGEKTNEAIETKAKEMGVEPSALYDMAKSPASAAMLLSSMKVPELNPQTGPGGTVNTAAFDYNKTLTFVDKSKPYTSGSVLEALKKSGGLYT